jgi:hypothetical protein
LSKEDQAIAQTLLRTVHRVFETTGWPGGCISNPSFLCFGKTIDKKDADGPYEIFQSSPKNHPHKRSPFNLSSVKNAIYHGVQSLVSEQLVTLIMNLHERAFVRSPQVEIFYNLYVDYIKSRGVTDIEFCFWYTHGGRRELE